MSNVSPSNLTHATTLQSYKACLKKLLSPYSLRESGRRALRAAAYAHPDRRRGQAKAGRVEQAAVLCCARP